MKWLLIESCANEILRHGSSINFMGRAGFGWCRNTRPTLVAKKKCQMWFALPPHSQQVNVFNLDQSVHGASKWHQSRNGKRKVSSLMKTGVRPLDCSYWQPFWYRVLGPQLAKCSRVDIGDKVTAILPKAKVSIAGVRTSAKALLLLWEHWSGRELDSSLRILILRMRRS